MLLAYSNNPEFKKECVAKAKQHRDADMLLKGTYGTIGEHFKGCSVGCDAYSIAGDMYFSPGPHKITAEYFGWPDWVEHLRDSIFEGLPCEESVNFHVELKEAIPVGMTETDWVTVHKTITIQRLETLAEQQEKSIGEKWGVVAAINQMIAAVSTGSKKEIDSAESAAESAAWSAAWSAAESAAWSAAESAAESAAKSAAESAAKSAAWSAAESAWSAAQSAWSAAQSAELAGLEAWQREAKNLLSAIEEVTK